MYSIVEQGGKQYLCSLNQIIKVEKVPYPVGEKFSLKSIPHIVGAPEGPSVTAMVLAHVKTDKVLVFKKKRRHNYRRKKGIDKIYQ
jgi:large subunit ribosomal protein L21